MDVAAPKRRAWKRDVDRLGLRDVGKSLLKRGADQGVDLLASVHQRGVRVVVITNSLASTDGVPVHSKYQLYRKRLIEAGVELYEIKPTAGAQLKRRFREPAGSSIGGLHAKTFAFDRRIGFIGSYNLDPRSSKLNT